MSRHHHELITAQEAGALALTFTVLFRPVASMVVGAVTKIFRKGQS